MDKPVAPSPTATQAEWFNYSQQNAVYSKWLADNPPPPQEAATAPATPPPNTGAAASGTVSSGSGTPA